MPRGGTTAVGNLFNLPEEAYCYAAESHWLPFLLEVAGDAPLPAPSFDIVREVLSQQNHSNLYEMVRDSVKRGAHPRALIFEREDVPPLTDAVMERLAAGLHGEALLQSVLPILRRHIESRTGKRILGEKTPNNVNAFGLYGALGTKAAVMVTRDPFAVLRSMENRTADPTDVYAAAFHRDIYRRVGIWLDYSQDMQKALQKPNCVLLRYEDLLNDPREAILDLYARTGITLTDPLFKRASSVFRVKTKGLPWERLSPREISLIRALTRAEAERSGFDAEFYARRGLPEPATDEIDLSEADLFPVSGANTPEPESGAIWLMRRGSFVLHQPAASRICRLHFWSHYHEAVLPRGTAAEITLRNAAGDLVGHAAVSAGSESASVDLDLSGSVPQLQNLSGAVHHLSFEVSHSFRPFTTAVKRFRQSIRLGDDRREISVALIRSEFL